MTEKGQKLRRELLEEQKSQTFHAAKQRSLNKYNSQGDFYRSEHQLSLHSNKPVSPDDRAFSPKEALLASRYRQDLETPTESNDMGKSQTKLLYPNQSITKLSHFNKGMMDNLSIIMQF